MTVAIHGLDARDGDTAFAFVVVRLVAAVDRAGVVVVVRALAALVADPEEFIAGLPEPLDESIRMLGLPWLPPDGDTDELATQRRAAEAAGAHGVEAVWCFQTGTRLADGADDDAGWSHGLPPQLAAVRFPVDGYPEILDELDGEDFGVAFKLAGAWTPGEHLGLIGFHTLWLAPYGDRYRNAAVTIDERHHAAHLWVDRFTAPTSAAAQVRHLLWVLAKIDEVTPIVHARFAGATAAQKYGRLIEDAGDTFVLGGNPLLAAYRHGDARVERWIAEQRTWSTAEVAQMLRELAVEIVTGGVELAGEGEEAAAVETASAATASLPSAEEAGGRQLTSYAGDVLIARAAAGVLSAAVVPTLRPVLAIAERYEHRRRAVIELVGALRDRVAVPALIRILDDNPIKNALDSIGKDALIADAADALGAIGDPAAIPALARAVAAAGAHNDKPRPIAAAALARCLAAAPPPRALALALADDVWTALLAAIEHDRDAEHGAGCQLAYGRLAATLPEVARAAARTRLANAPVTRGGPVAMLARHAALALAGAEPPIGETRATIAAALHTALTTIGYDHDGTLRDLRIALHAAAALPALVVADDVVWLTRFVEADVRASAHALLAVLGRALPPAAQFDRVVAGELADTELIAQLGEPHVVGRGALIAEAGRRGLVAARRPIAAAAAEVIDRARASGNVLDPDTRVLEAAVIALRTPSADATADAALDDLAIALFDRMLRHPNHHVKWELLQEVPADERLLGGMFHVLGEKWGWQETHAKEWLAQFRGRPAYEAARRGLDATGGARSEDDDTN